MNWSTSAWSHSKSHHSIGQAATVFFSPASAATVTACYELRRPLVVLEMIRQVCVELLSCVCVELRIECGTRVKLLISSVHIGLC